jgi:hypothetical protein
MKASETNAPSTYDNDCLVQRFTGASLWTAVEALSFQHSVQRLSSIPRTGNDFSKSALFSNPGSLNDFNHDLGVTFVSMPRLYLRLI